MTDAIGSEAWLRHQRALDFIDQVDDWGEGYELGYPIGDGILVGLTWASSEDRDTVRASGHAWRLSMWVRDRSRLGQPFLTFVVVGATKAAILRKATEIVLSDSPTELRAAELT